MKNNINIIKMKQIKQIVKRTDIYGNIIGFKYEGDDRIKSVFGGCLTVCLVIISIIVFAIRIEGWASNNYNLEVKTSIFSKDLTTLDSFNSTNLGFRLGVLELNKNGTPTTLGELHPIGDNSINQVSLAANPFLHENQKSIGDIIKCYKNKKNNFLPLLINLQDSSFKDTYKNFLCSNISKETNISLNSDFIFSNRSDYLESNLFFDVCKVTSKCKDSNALYTTVQNDFRLFLSLNNQYFNKMEYKGFRSTFTSYVYQRVDFNKDITIDVVVTKNIIITDPNKIFNFIPQYYNEFYSVRAILRETYRPDNLSSGSNIMKIKIVFRADDSEVYIYRNFEAADNLIANTSTIVFAVYFVFKLLLFFFKKGNLTLSLLNKIYQFKEEDESKIDFETFQSVAGKDSYLGRRSKLGNQDNIIKDRQGKDNEEPKNNIAKNQIDNSLANLNQQNESQQDNPLRIEFKVKESPNNEDGKDKTNNSINFIQKYKTNRDVNDSKKNMIEMPSIISAKGQQLMLEINAEDDNKNLPGLTHLTNIDKGEKFLNKLDIPKTQLFFYICFGQCYRRSSLSPNYYYVGKEFLNYDLNIETYLKKVIEYEAFKRLLLTEKHRKLLVTYQKRKITKDNFVKGLDELRSYTQYSEFEINKSII